MNNRVLISKNGSLFDVSVQLNNLFTNSKALDYVALEDAIYVGARLPFNHAYFRLGGVANQIAASMKVEYYDGLKWQECVEVIDETEAFSKHGMVQFTPNKRHQWAMRSTKDDSETIPELSSVVIYDRYWIRITFDQTLTPGVELAWIGNIFANDEDLGAEFPDLNKANIKTAFKAGKADWFEQHATAGKLVINDLVDRGVIVEKGQILDWRDYTLAAVSKVAELIFGSFGDDYVNDRNSARDEYIKRIGKKRSSIDSNNDAVESPEESRSQQGFFSR